MSYDNKELEIKLQFLDEAQDYVNTLESSVLGLSTVGVDLQRVNTALRAAHSIKGGAAMMGYVILSELAHQLEDSFKVLKIQREAIAVDATLESHLLAAIDSLNRVIAHEKQGTPVDKVWVQTQALPIFELLHQQLGDPQEEDASSVLATEDSQSAQDILRILFESEVEGCLERLASVIANQDPCLKEEVEILAQELGGLGEMLQLLPFTQLCQSVTDHVLSAPERMADIAVAALQTWRRSQALVLTGNLTELPTAITVPGVTLTAPPVTGSEAAIAEFSPEFDWDNLGNASENLTDPSPDRFSSTDWSGSFSRQGVSIENTESEPEIDIPIDTVARSNLNATTDTTWHEFVIEVEPVSDSVTERIAELHTEFYSAQPIEQERAAIESPLDPESAQKLSDRKFSVVPANAPLPTQPASTGWADGAGAPRDASADAPTVNPTPIESPDVMVRVSSKQLDQLNDLVGELTIERNAIDLHLKRLRGLVQSLGQRVQTLDESNAQLRDNYDRVETRSLQSPFLLPGSSVSGVQVAGSDNALSLERSRQGFDSTFNTHFNTRFDANFDALEMDRYDSIHQLSQEVMETIVQIQEVTNDIELGLDDSEQTARNLNKTARQLQTKLTRVRMRPLSDITDRFPRALRELSLQYDKPVRLQVYGGNVLIDRNILDALNEPLMHLMRNAFDHGIEDRETRILSGKPEEGVLSIRATNQNNRTVITVQDDGAGIALEKIRNKARQMGLDELLLASASEEDLLSLIFEPGFSTSEQVTALSGRGVGMDIVRNRLKQVQGDIKVNTLPGLGTTFTLSVPFTLSITRVLLVESNRMLMALPMDLIEEILVLQPEQVMLTAGSEIFSWQGTMVQLVRLGRSLRFNCPRQVESLESVAAVNVPSVLLLNPGGQRVGIEIDRSWGEQEVTIRQVEGGLPMPPGFSHCTILGDGRVVPLVNVPELLRWLASRERNAVRAVPTIDPFAGSASPMAASPGISSPTSLGQANGQGNGQGNGQANGQASSDEQQPTILIVDDSVNVRRLLALTLEKAGYQVAQAKDGQDALDKLATGLAVRAVICDIEMPRLDGYGFLARFRSNPGFDRIPITMLTTRSGEKHRQLAMNLGATAYVSKPYNEQALLQTLEQLMATA